MGEVKPLDTISANELYQAWEKAFSDYVLQISKDELVKMLHRRGYDATLSFGYFEDGRLVSFLLNGVGEWQGMKTAYDTGTGTAKDFRNKGLATKVFQAAVPHLQEAGVQQYLLEVLQDNTAAISIYKQQGFTITREFNYFTINNALSTPRKPLNNHYRLKKIGLETVSKLNHLHDFEPSWQNNNAALLKKPENFEMLAVYEEDTIVGYGVIESLQGDIPQLAVHKNYRRQGLGTIIFNELLKLSKTPKIRVINTDITCESITQFLQQYSIAQQGKQYEMVKMLK
jgi:ribosomal protein S18 acetylase RimI-like enzyme